MKKLFYIIILLCALVVNTKAQQLPSVVISWFDGSSILPIAVNGMWTTKYTPSFDGTVLVRIKYQLNSLVLRDSVNQIVFANQQYLSIFQRGFAQAGVYTLTLQFINNGSILATQTRSLTVTGTTDVLDMLAVPTEFALKQNYPNPFNPSTTISYQLPESANVSLIIYDVTGREVANLVSAFKPAGQHTAQFNAANLPSGMYIYRIIAGNFTASNKMMLVK